MDRLSERVCRLTHLRCLSQASDGRSVAHQENATVGSQGVEPTASTSAETSAVAETWGPDAESKGNPDWWSGFPRDRGRVRVRAQARPPLRWAHPGTVRRRAGRGRVHGAGLGVRASSARGRAHRRVPGLSRRLSRLGAPASTGRHLREAIEADQVLSIGITAGTAGSTPTAIRSPPGCTGARLTNLITWPINGEPPQHLHVFTTTSARGPPPRTHPTARCCRSRSVSRFLDHLLTVAERADRARTRPCCAVRRCICWASTIARTWSTWLRAEWNRAGRRPVGAGDVTGLLEARSAWVALAAAGDGTAARLRRAHRPTSAEAANLNYWAHWIGELDDEQPTTRSCSTTTPGPGPVPGSSAPHHPAGPEGRAPAAEPAHPARADRLPPLLLPGSPPRARPRSRPGSTGSRPGEPHPHGARAGRRAALRAAPRHR